jgi:hypothetical protein
MFDRYLDRSKNLTHRGMGAADCWGRRSVEGYGAAIRFARCSSALCNSVRIASRFFLFLACSTPLPRLARGTASGAPQDIPAGESALDVFLSTYRLQFALELQVDHPAILAWGRDHLDRLNPAIAPLESFLQ